MKKIISILGSTGSIGLNSLRIIEVKKKLFKINLLSANKNFVRICHQIEKYNPNTFIINDKKIYERVKKKYLKKKIKILNNFDGYSQKKKSDITISAIPGVIGLNLFNIT